MILFGHVLVGAILLSSPESGFPVHQDVPITIAADGGQSLPFVKPESAPQSSGGNQAAPRDSAVRTCVGGRITSQSCSWLAPPSSRQAESLNSAGSYHLRP